MKITIGLFFNAMEYFLHKPKLNVWKTLYVNFRSMPFREAWHLPIYIYGKCVCLSLKGSITVRGQLQKGVITVGLKRNNIKSYKAPTIIRNRGNIILTAGCWLDGGVRLSVGDSAYLFIGRETVLGDNTSVLCERKIFIDDFCSIGNNNVIVDTDSHFILNINTRECKDESAPIFLGKNCWITNNVTIKKGACLPIGTIVAGPFSTLSKDYTTIIAEYSVLAGSPAKLVKQGFRRVKNLESEKLIRDHFMQTEAAFKLDVCEDINNFCLHTASNG